MTTAAVVLAAGGGSRFEGVTHKLLAPLRGRPVVAWAIDAARTSGLDDLLVVVGAIDLTPEVPPGATVVPNPAWAEGLATSLVAGIRAAAAAGHDAVVVGLGDQPFVPAEAWRAVAAAPADPPIAVATYEGRARNPVRLPASIWPLLPMTGDDGARALISAQPDLVQRVPCLVGHPADVDTQEDLRRWN